MGWGKGDSGRRGGGNGIGMYKKINDLIFKKLKKYNKMLPKKVLT